MDNTQKTAVTTSNQATEKPAELIIAADVDTKVSTPEAQRKTAVWMAILMSLMMLMVGFILAIYSIVWFAGPDGMSMGYSTLSVNSCFAMGIVGVGLIFWGVIAMVIGCAMQVKNKTNHKIGNSWGIANWFILNPLSWSMIRQSNGYVSKKQKEKLAKAAAAASSNDSVDVKADVQEEQQAQTTEIN